MRERINGLYARRGEEVRLAREIRESVGRATGAYDLVWHRAEALTREIAEAEAELEKAVNAAADVAVASQIRPQGSLAFARRVLDLAEDITSGNWGMGVTGIIEACRAEIAQEVAHG